MPATAICISHTEGAGGAEIGRAVADRLGFRYADDGIVVDAARAQGLDPDAVSLAESREAGRQVEVDFGKYERTESLRGLIRDAILAAADEGNVVIVAHAASYTLADRDGVLRVFVTAPTETRVLRLVEAERLDAKSAKRIVKESDKARAAYLKSFYGVARELPTHYDLVLNTDKLVTETAAAAIVDAAGSSLRS